MVPLGWQSPFNQEISMTKIRSLYAVAAAAGVALLALGGTSSALARDVNWAIGLSSPGVAVGVGNGYPVYAAPAPVYYAPNPVYYAPPPPVYYAPPRPVYYAPPVVVGAPVYGGYYRGGGHRHWRGDEGWRGDDGWRGERGRHGHRD